MAIDRTKAASVGLVRLLYRNLRDLITGKYTKPGSGIPASDLAEGVIPDISGKADASVTDHLQVTKAPIIFNSAIGNPIRIEDGADNLPIEKCEVSFGPIQDLHGQTAPYPPGGGKNLLNANGTSEYFTVSDGVYTVSVVPDAAKSFVIGTMTLKQGETYILSGGLSSSLYVSFTYNGTVYRSQGNDSQPFTATGDDTISIAGVITTTAEVGQKLFPMVRLSSISDSTYATYSNICPIDGWRWMNINRSGKNVFKPADSLTFPQTKYGYTFTQNQDGSITAERVESSNSHSVLYLVDGGTKENSLFPSGTYTLTGFPDNSGFTSTNTVIQLTTRSKVTDEVYQRRSLYINRLTLTFTITDNEYVSDVFIRIDKSETATVTFKIQLELGSEVTDYEKCVNAQIPVYFPARGANLLDDSKKVLTSNNIYLGTTKAGFDFNRSVHLQPGTYTLTVTTSDGTNSNLYVRYVGESDNLVRELNTKTATFTIDHEANVIIWAYKVGYNEIGVNAITSAMLNSGETAQTYEPYVPVYGGKLNALTGLLTVYYGMVDMGSLDWNRNVDRFVVSANKISPAAYSQSAWNVTDPIALCDIYKYGNVINGNGTDKVIGFYEGTLYARDTDYTDADDFAEFVSGVRLAYKLATPIEIQLSANEMRSLLGTNTIFTDANGNIDLMFRADTWKFIEQYAVKDVTLQDNSIVEGRVAKLPLASTTQYGMMMVGNGLTINSTSKKVQISGSTASEIKAGTVGSKPIVPSTQHISAFYALSKIAGFDLANESVTLGTYPDAALQAIQKLLGMAGLIGPYEDDITADQAYAIGETFVMNGKRYKATAAIAQSGVITPGTNCELCPLSLSDIQINGQSIIQNGVANIPLANGTNPGVVIVGSGLSMDANGKLYANFANSTRVKAGTASNYMIATDKQHESVFYALAKLAGADMASLTGETVGIYPQAQKTAIQTMLGIEALPAVAAADNGKILQVVNGEWAAASIPNANGVSF